MTKKIRTLAGDTERGFAVRGRTSLDKFNDYYEWCKRNKQIAVEVQIYGNHAICKIDTFPPDCRNHPFRFSNAQLGQLLALCIKHNWRKKSLLHDVFSMLHFSASDALAFAADVAEWLKTVEIPN